MRTRRQALGQHFLKHQPTIQQIIGATEPFLNDSQALVEVGPGALAITKSLAQVAAQRQMPLFLVERDRRLDSVIASGLEQCQARVELSFFDAATDQMAQFIDTIHKQEKFNKILFVSNLPYSASSQILAQLCPVSHLLSGAVIMVQKELAQRMVAKEGSKHRGSFGIFMQSYFECRMLFDVPPQAFSPPPKVMSTVLALTPLIPSAVAHLAAPQEFHRFCQNLFSHRRKMIRGLLPPEVLPLLSQWGLDGTERPEALSLSVLLDLYRGGTDHGSQSRSTN